MPIKYRGFEIIVNIVERPTAWIVDIEICKTTDGVLVKEIPAFKEEFSHTDGALNVLLYMQKKAEKKIDDYILSNS